MFLKQINLEHACSFLDIHNAHYNNEHSKWSFLYGSLYNFAKAKHFKLQSTFVILYIMIHLENARWDSSRINLIAKVRVSQKWKRRLRAKVKLFRAELWQILEKGLSDKWKMIMEIQYQWRSHTPTFKWVSEGQDGMENHHKIMNIISMR